MGGAAPARDYGYIIRILTARLIRDLSNEENLRRFAQKFLRYTPTTRPIVGIGFARSEGPLGIVEFLSTVEPDDIDLKGYLSSEGISIPFQVTNTGPIVASSSWRLSTSRTVAQGGDEIQRTNGPVGTFGCLVDHDSGSVILTCHHVLASLQDQRVRHDVLWCGHAIGVTQTFEPIVFGPDGTNEIDAALCKPKDIKQVKPGLRILGPVSGYLQDPPFGLLVKKEGAASGVTEGRVQLKSLSMAVAFPEVSLEAIFVDQLGIIGTSSGRFALPGDSGSVIVNETKSLIGLLSAVSTGVDIAYANPIESVFRKLAIRVS